VTHDQAEAMTLADRVAVMDRGRIAQLGSPREIYDEPATRFVADFVGRANFLAGTVRGRDGALLFVDVLGRVRTIAAAPGAEDASTVEVMIRPEAIQLAAAGEPDTIAARVVRASFLGANAMYQLASDAGELVASLPLDRGAALPTDGAAVGVRVRDDAMRAFPLSGLP
jgi:spermidine/putrescine transport system ATP-binding protein